MKTISPQLVKKIADLSYLELTEEELEKYTKELSSILDFIEILKKVDTKGVEPVWGNTDLEDVMREDKVFLAEEKSKNKEDKEADETKEINELIKRAPKSSGRYLKTKAIL